MTTDDVLEWIAKKNASLSIKFMKTKNERSHLMLIGGTDVLNQLRMHILMKTNPYNREDIKKFNEKNES